MLWKETCAVSERHHLVRLVREGISVSEASRTGHSQDPRTPILILSGHRDRLEQNEFELRSEPLGIESFERERSCSLPGSSDFIGIQ